MPDCRPRAGSGPFRRDGPPPCARWAPSTQRCSHRSRSSLGGHSPLRCGQVLVFIPPEWWPFPPPPGGPGGTGLLPALSESWPLRYPPTVGCSHLSHVSGLPRSPHTIPASYVTPVTLGFPFRPTCAWQSPGA